MKIYSLNTTDFSNNGYGFLTDVISAEVNEEINGNYTLTMEYLLNGHLAEYLIRENIIVCKVADGTEQPFRIKYIERNFKTMNIIAYHISYDLGDDLVINTAPTNLTAQAFGRWVLNNSTTHAQNFTFNSDITATASARYIRKNVLECFMSDADNSMLNKFKGEFKRDNYTITFNTRIGQDSGVKLLVGKNINEINITIDDTELFTRIVPVGYDGLTIPEIYVDSILINNYPHPKGCIAKFEDIKYDETGEDPDAYDNLNDFYDALRAAANQMFTDGVDKPLINVDIDWLDLAKTKEYENYTSLETIRLGDTLTCDMGDFQYTTRVIATTYDVLLDRITNFEIGKPKASYASQANATIQELSEVDTSNLLEQAQTNASNLLKDAMTGYIYFDYDNGNLYIMDNPDPDDAVKVWRWNLNGLGYSSTGINGTYGLAITMDGSIVADYITTGTLNTAVIQGYDSLVQSVANIENLLLEDSGTGALTYENVSRNTPYYMQIYPTATDISYTYPSNNLYPSNTTYMQTRTLRFTNNNTHETFDYVLPCDLLYYDSSHYDVLTIDGDTLTCIKTKMVDYDSSGNKITIPAESISYPFVLINLTEGDYSVDFISYNDVYKNIKLIRKNDITDLFASSVYAESKIQQTKNEIDLQVQQKVSDNEIIAKINLAVDEGQGIIDIKGNQVKITSDNFTLDQTGKITATAGDIAGFEIDQENGFVKKIYAPYDYTQADLERVYQIIMGQITPTAEDYEKYDLSENGTITAVDYVLIYWFIKQGITTTNYGKFIIDAPNIKRLDSAKMGYVNGYGNFTNGIGYDGGKFNKVVLTENTTTEVYATPSYINMYANREENPTISLNSETGEITCVSLTQTSQEKNKKNFELYKDSALKEIKNIDIYKYNLIGEEDTDKKHLGFVIGDKYKYSKEITNNDNTGVDNYSFTSLLCKAIQEQQEQIDELKKEIKSLKEVKNDKDNI